MQLLSKEGRAGWVREEALATVESIDFLSFPSASVDAAITERPSFAFAVPALFAGMQRRLIEAQAGPVAGVADHSGPAPQSADAYGTRQLMFVRTRTSKVFGLHSSDGSIIWSHFVPPATPSGVIPTIHSTFVSGHGTSPHLLVVIQDSSSYRVRALHPFTGRMREESTGDGRVLHAARLPYDMANGVQPLLVVDESMRVSVFPKTEEATILMRQHAAEVFFYLLDSSDRLISRPTSTDCEAMPLSCLALPHICSSPLTFTSHASRPLISAPLPSPPAFVETPFSVSCAFMNPSRSGSTINEQPPNLAHRLSGYGIAPDEDGASGCTAMLRWSMVFQHGG